MLETFVIGLREGVEASLIIGIVAAFLLQQGGRRALRPMWAGVGAAVALCLGVAITLQLVSRSLPERQQEGLETIVTALAVGMVTFMIVWMRRHAHHLPGQLRASARTALARGSVWALVTMAFFAVLREGLETSVFPLAAFQSSESPVAASAGALLGIGIAIGLGWGVYRGGTRLDLARFFRVTAIALVLVAGGLVAMSLHTAHEAGWIDFGQAEALNLSWLVQPGTVVSSLVTGMLGLRARPTVIEVAGWLVYAVPVLLYVLWPHGARRQGRTSTAEVGTAPAV
jgi:high-affinity iron transporter